MNNNSKKNNSNQGQTTLSQADKLAIISGLISTFGGGLGTIATLLALQEEQLEIKQDRDNNDYIINELHSLKKQVNTLQKELKQIKKMLSRLS